MSHTVGAKPYARYRVEQRKAHLEGQDPDRMEMFQATHTKRDGSFVDAESAARMRQMEDIVSEHPKGSDRSTVRNETFKQVMGPDGHGRVRMYGYSVTPTQMRGASAAAETEHWRRMCEDAQVRATASDAHQTELSSIVASQGDMIIVLQNTMSKMEGFMRNFGREVNTVPSFSSFDTDSTQPPDATQR